MNTSRSANTGVVSISIDNSTPIQVDTYANTATAQCGVSWSSPPLPNGPHTVSNGRSYLSVENAMTHFRTPPGCYHFDGPEPASSSGWQYRCFNLRTRRVYVSVSRSPSTTSVVLMVTRIVYSVSNLANDSAALPALVRHGGRCFLVSLLTILLLIICTSSASIPLCYFLINNVLQNYLKNFLISVTGQPASIYS